ncbi:MAG TPA: hypothetical protein VF666_13090 [Pyrinomonadaceae bacterium]|jgi:hypothetical protein
MTEKKTSGRHRSLAAVVFVLLACASVCGKQISGSVASSSNGRLRVLFIGNSFTYTNDLPSVVGALAEATEQKRFVYKAVVGAGYSLEDHWNRADARKAIAEGVWDVVILQQGPSASTDGRAYLLEYTQRFATEIRRVGAKTALYMVWPSTNRRRDFDGVSESYRLAAEQVKGMLFPVGEAWRAAWRRDASLALYSADGLHPTMLGTYLAALVIYEQLYGRPPAALLKNFKLRTGNDERIELSQRESETLLSAAREANEKFGRR